MQEVFSIVQKNFMDLSLFLSSLDLEKDLQKQDVLEEVNSALYQTYTLFEEGLCEAVPMCNKCDTNKNHLKEVVALIDSCASNKKMTHEASGALHDFLEIIPQILKEMKTLYIASLTKTS